jgi:hypothetical protein
MIIWFLILIPIITILFLLIKYSKNVTWWEYLIHFGVAILLIVVMKIIGEKSLTNDMEYWGDLIKQAKYYEPYSIWDHETCTKQVACGTDSKGRTKYCSKSYDCSHLDSHPAHWEVVTVTGWEISISEDFYNRLVKKFGVNVCFQDMNREGECGFGDHVVKDGNMYYTEWSGSPQTSYALVKTHTYENKVQCSKSVFNYQKIKPEEAKKAGLYDYPDIKNNEIATVLGGNGLTNLDSIEGKFHYLNGNLGPKKQLRVWILIFRDKPISTGKDQEIYWKNGNKNEFVVTIGLDKQNQITWCHPFSWTDKSELKIETRDYVMSQKTLNLMRLADYLYKELDSKWVRKQFKDFSYLTVEPPLWGLIVAFVLQILFNVFYAIWAVKNEFDNEES